MDTLQEYRVERDALLQRAVKLLETDERVVAAWLHGSIGRVDHDDLSDIDLWAVVADEHMEAVGAERHEYAARVRDPLLIVEAPQNAPPGGAYLLVQYPSQHGPVTLDLSWQPRSQARVSANVRVLFDRVGLPPAEPPEPLTQDERTRLVRTESNFFWAMCPIAAKYIARRSTWDVLGMVQLLTGTLNWVKWYAGVSSSEPGYRNIPAVPPLVQPNDQLALLRQIADEMKVLAERTPILREAVPEEAVEQVYSYFGMIEMVSKLIQCPCCGHYTLDSRGDYDICPVCFWEDDDPAEQYGQPVKDRALGPNGVQLREARISYKDFGESEERARSTVRPPSWEEIPENN